MGYPRAVITRHPMGRPIGPPGDTSTHLSVVERALDLLEEADTGGSIVELRIALPPGPEGRVGGLGTD